jgi:catechol 2,3-dioxygenase-like lactoylglutathione lyase family enzyme
VVSVHQAAGLRAPGSLGGLQLNVDDVEEVHAFLTRQGLEVSDVQDYPWGRFCFFSDPDGNGWSVHGPQKPQGSAV